MIHNECLKRVSRGIQGASVLRSIINVWHRCEREGVVSVPFIHHRYTRLSRGVFLTLTFQNHVFSPKPSVEFSGTVGLRSLCAF